MRVKIYPSRAAGEVFPPPSKSMAHRFLVCAGLADGESTIRNVALSEDILATIDCLKALGAQVNANGESISVKGAKRPFAAGIMPCRESGSTLRFFIPICLLDGKRRVFKGSERLLSRPLSVYEDICREKCFEFSRGFGEITVSGRLCGGRYAVPGDISSQFISGLLFAFPIVNGDSAIELVPPVESRPYIDMTLFSLSSFGVRAEWTGENELLICGGQDYSPADLTVEGDCSNAAFLAAMNLAGGSVRIKGLNSATLQGDRVYEELFERIKRGFCEIDVKNCPDLAPVLMAAAALLKGVRLTGTSRLKIKESDRAEAMREELEKLGVKVVAERNAVTVFPSTLSAPSEPVSSHNDHRIAMAMAVLLTVTGGEIDGAEAVKKSFPDFFEKLAGLGVKVEKYGMDK